MAEEKRGRTRRVRRLLTRLSLGNWRAIPSWLLIFLGALWKLAEISHTTEFLLRSIVHGHFDPLWLVAVGIVWLVGVVIWAAMRPDAAEQERQMGYLKDSAVECIRRFEALSYAYEQSGPQAGSEQARKAREAFLTSVEHVIIEALATLPNEKRDDYNKVLIHIFMNYHATLESFPVTLFSQVAPPIRPIEQTINLHKPTPPE